jgi:DNA-directed RNA polymerase specialized sigma24 family protein
MRSKFRGVRYMEVINEAIIEENVEIEDENISIDYLLQIIQELPDQYRLVFSLYVLDGYSHTRKLLKCYKLLLEQQSQISLEPELF